MANGTAAATVGVSPLSFHKRVHWQIATPMCEGLPVSGMPSLPPVTKATPMCGGRMIETINSNQKTIDGQAM